MIILFGGKEYAVGLTWFSISSPSEIDQFKREMDMSCGVMKLSKEDGEPSCVALAPSEYANQVSLAAAISYAHENVIYVCKTEYKDEAGRLLYYFCCVKHGTVTVEGDTIADIDTIQSLYAQSLMDLRTDVPEEKIECLGTDVSDDRFEGVQPIDVIHMVTSIQRFEGQCSIKELKKEGPSKVKVAILAVLALAVVLMAYFYFKPAPPPPAPVMHAPIVHAPAPAEPFIQLLNSIQFQNTMAVKGLPLIAAALDNIPIQTSGWQLNEIVVNIGAVTRFTVTLDREPFATVNGLEEVEKAGTFKEVSFDSSGEKARVTWGTAVTDVPLMTKEALEVIKNEKTSLFRSLFLTKMQTETMKITLDEPVKVAGYSVQKFTYKSQGLWSIGGFADVFQDMTTMGITSLHIRFADGNYEWEIQGVIYG